MGYQLDLIRGILVVLALISLIVSSLTRIYRGNKKYPDAMTTASSALRKAVYIELCFLTLFLGSVFFLIIFLLLEHIALGVLLSLVALASCGIILKWHLE